MKLSLQGYRVYIALLIVVIASAGCHKSDPGTVYIPAVTTSSIFTDVTTTSVQANGYIYNFVTGSISQYGVCYSTTNTTPTIGDSKTVETTANAIHFVTTMTGLTPNTKYYVRAYATGMVSDTYYGDVVQYTTPTTTFSIAATTATYAGTGVAGYLDGTAKAALFSSPQGIVADAAGNLYVTDSFNNCIRKISVSGTVTTLAGGTTPGYTDASGTAARFYSPQFISIDASGNLYVSDVGNNAIRKITTTGVVTTFAGGGLPGYADNTVGTLAKFNTPGGLAVSASGNIYVADRGNNIIRMITPAGVVTTYCGAQASGFVDGVSVAARFNRPTGLAIDASGVLYVADLSNNSIRKIATDTTVTTLVGNPTTRPDLVNLPVALARDTKGNLFVTDESGRIMELTVGNIFYSLAGVANTSGYTEGKGSAALFNNPQGVTTDAAGNLYVADYSNNVIRKLVISTTQ